MFILITGLLAMTIIVAVHEWGHLLAARMCHVPVKTFSVGMGPSLAMMSDRHGTVWQIALIPIGGYVMLDEEAMEKATPKAQIWIAAAGPLFSFLLAFGLLFMLTFAELSSVETAGLVGRFVTAAIWAAVETFGFIERTVQLLQMLFTGEVSITSLSGPVGIVHVTGEQAAIGWQAYVWILATLSVSVGVLNLLPFLPLDGGRIVAGLLRYVVGDTWSKRYAFVQSIPFIVLLLIVLVTVTYHDIVRVFWQ